MKRYNSFPARWPLLLGIICETFNFLPAAHAQSLYYNPASSSPASWSGNAWSTSAAGPYTSGWTDGRAAVFNFSSQKTLQLGSDVQLTGLTTQAAGVVLSGTGTSRTNVVFANGSEVSSSAQSSGNTIDLGNNLDISGNFTLTSGQINFATGGTSLSYNGTATINSGARIQFSNSISGANANFAVSGALRSGGGNRSLGSVTLNSGGNFDIGAGGTDATSVTIKSLAGLGGTVTTRTGTGVAVHQFTLDQAINTTFSGDLQGVNTNGDRRLKLTKTNTGTLILNGSVVNLQEGATVSGGTLLINGAGTRTFNNLSGANAITVAAGGAFGGNSTLSIAGGESVVVQNGGLLIAGGGPASVGTTGFTFSSGGNLDLSGVNSASGWLHFDLGANTQPGVDYDQILLTGGNLALGSGLLEFEDFSFNALSGFGAGDYTLFAANSHSGGLGALLSGAIGDGFTGTLSLNGDNVVLNVSAVPEPQYAMVFLGGFCLTVELLRRRRSTDRS